MTLTPRGWQAEALPIISRTLREGRPALLSASTGCHAAGQLVLMYDGTTRRVEDVQVGDLLMGPDSTPRRVLRLCRGRDEMFEIRPVKGEPWIVNGDHVLSLVDTRRKYGGRTRDVTVRDWMGWSKTNRAMFKLFRAPAVDFSDEQPYELDPYFVGVILGDGCTLYRRVHVCTPDPEIVACIYEQAERWGATVTKTPKPGNRAADYRFHYRHAYADLDRPLHRAVHRAGLSGKGAGEKAVPRAYLTGSKTTRKEILAGLLDTDGHYTGGGFDYISKSPQLADDVAFLARSLGLAAYVKPCEKFCQTGGGGTYYRVSISGDCTKIPNRVARKQAAPRQQIKNVRRTGFSVRPLGMQDDYYGFTLDGDHRYLLGDFTVTHNSGKSIFTALLLQDVLSTLRDGLHVVVTVPTQELVRQLHATLSKHCGGPEVVGMYYGSRKQIRKITICCLPSLERLGYELRTRGVRVALWVGDEVHRAEAYAEHLELMNPMRRLGVTATPYRSSTGLSLWPEVTYRYGMEDAIRDGCLVPPEIKLWRGPKDIRVDVAMIKMIRDHATGPGAVSCTNIAEAEEMAELLTSAGIKAATLHSKTKGRRERIEALRTGEISALVHVRILSEGVDLPWLRWVGLGTSHSRTRVNLVQEVGRVLRIDPDNPGKTSGLVLDPLGLTVKVGIRHTADLVAEAVDGEETPSQKERREEMEIIAIQREKEKAQRFDELTIWLAESRHRLDPRVDDINPTAPPTARQLADLEKHRKGMRWLDAESRERVKFLLEGEVTQGVALDVIAILRKAKKDVAPYVARGQYARAPRLKLG